MNKDSALIDTEDTTDQEESGETDNERQSDKEKIMSYDKFTPICLTVGNLLTILTQSKQTYFKNYRTLRHFEAQ